MLRKSLLRRPLFIGLAAFLALVVLASGAAYAYYFTGLRSVPAPLSLSSFSSIGSNANTSADALVGHWVVATGSQAGYRVKEDLLGEATKHEAVARTGAVTGELTVRSGSSGLQVNGLRFVVQLASLQSVDSVAGHNVTNRDRAVGRSLNIQQFPEAEFAASTLTVPAKVAQGETARVTLPGTFTVHGVARPAKATAQVRAAGGKVQAAGSIPLDMTEFGVTPPHIPFAQSDAQLMVDFQLFLSKG
jgi:polyisoprenoid-binding protein YceI